MDEPDLANIDPDDVERAFHERPVASWLGFAFAFFVGAFLTYEQKNRLFKWIYRNFVPRDEDE